jgi:cytochrome c oxidase assembly protein subunit 11
LRTVTSNQLALDKTERTLTMRKLVVLVGLMFCFGYAMVPLYKKICEVTGVNILGLREEKEKGDLTVENTQVDLTRKVTIDFDANGRSALQFRPKLNSIQVHPGELTTVIYEVINTRNIATVGQAIPSYAPKHSGQYFRKLECFCFKQQNMDALQTREFPVVFVIDPKVPKDVTTITLSYTFFEVNAKAAGVILPDSLGAPKSL